MKREPVLFVIISTAAVVTLAGCSSLPMYTSVDQNLATFEPFHVPLEVTEHGVALLTVQSSAGPLQLILDTGADQAMLIRMDSPVAESLPQAGAEWEAGASGGLSRVPVFQLDEVHIGPLTFNDVRAPAESSAFPDFMPGDGMLGRGLLVGLTLDIDMPVGRLGILPAGALPSDFNRDDWLAVPLLSMHDGPVVPMRLDDSETTLRMVLDTGAIAFADDDLYGIVELPRELKPARDQVEGLTVYRAANVRLGDVPVGPMRFFVMNHPQPPNTEGFLGSVLQMQWRIVIVPTEDRVYLRNVPR